MLRIALEEFTMVGKRYKVAIKADHQEVDGEVMPIIHATFRPRRSKGKRGRIQRTLKQEWTTSGTSGNLAVWLILNLANGEEPGLAEGNSLELILRSLLVQGVES